MKKHETDSQVTGDYVESQAAVLPDGTKQSSNAYQPVLVDYGMRVEEAVELGCYDWVEWGITSRNFPTRRKGKADVVVELIHFNRWITTDEVLSELDKAGYRPAELHELLAFGCKYPDVQREFPIVALGSILQSRDGRFVPYLDGDGSRRDLFLSWAGDNWDGYGPYWDMYYRFAAVRK